MKSDIPEPYVTLRNERPDLVEAYESFAGACADAGPLDAKQVALCKLAISLGAGLDRGARSHARKAIDAGCTHEELLHVAHLVAPTCGFPAMMRARKALLDLKPAP